MALSFINKVKNMTNENYTDDYNNSMFKFQSRANKLRLGYTPGVIRHYFHGSKENRRYTERWKLLINNNYSPDKDICYDENGILVPTNCFSKIFKEDIMNYFKERKEDD